MVEELSCDESRIWILGQPLICRFCAKDVFIPYRTYKNVEQPGIDVFFVNYTAACMQCGCVTQFGDPSGPSPDGTEYIWAFEQILFHPPEPKPPEIRVVDIETLQAEKRCLGLALRLLVTNGKVDSSVLQLAEEEQYAKVMELLRQDPYGSDQEANSLICLATALSEIASHRIVDFEKISYIVEHESYPEIESFLQHCLK